MMPILVKSDDARRGRKAGGYGRAVTGGTGVNGLNLVQKALPACENQLSSGSKR